jgi:hypothetical protein
MDGEDGRYGDQKYLDDWPTRFENVVVLQHKGAGLAPWNLAGYTCSIQGKQVYVDEVPLIFYHFAQFRMVTEKIFIHNTEPYTQSFETRILKTDHIRYIYTPYAQAMQKMEQKIREKCPNHKTPNEKIPFLSFLHMLSKGVYFPAQDNIIAHLIVSIGLWRSESNVLARKGFHMNGKGDRKGAKKTLIASAFRSPRILFNPKFWRVLIH